MYVNHSVQRTPVKAPVVTRLLWLGRATITLGLAAYLIWQLKDQLGLLQLNLV